MAVSPEPLIGTTVSIIASVPASESASAYAALSWVEIGSVTEIPEFSESATDNTLTLLKTGTTQHYNGARGVEPFDITYVIAPTDAGQNIVRANYNGATEVSVRIVYPDGITKYVQAVLGNLRHMPANADAWGGEMINVRPITLAVTVKAA
jgi:hypothetical protein